MTRIVSFNDGFISSSAPVVAGGTQENYVLLNNQSLTDIVGLSFDSTLYKSVFIDAEIIREGSSLFVQTIQLQLYFDGSDWNLTTGNSSGSDILNDTLISDEAITLSIDSSGQVSYSTGNLSGHISSTLKISIVRISV